MSEREFFFATPRWFAARQKAWTEGVQRDWEQARFVGFWMLKTVDSKNRIRSPEKLIRFPWEEMQTVEFAPITKEELDRFSDEADKVLEKTNPDAYARYIAQLSESLKLSESSPDPDFAPSGELNF